MSAELDGAKFDRRKKLREMVLGPRGSKSSERKFHMSIIKSENSTRDRVNQTISKFSPPSSIARHLPTQATGPLTTYHVTHTSRSRTTKKVHKIPTASQQLPLLFNHHQFITLVLKQPIFRSNKKKWGASPQPRPLTSIS